MNIQYRENISIKLKKCLANEAYIFYSYLLGSNSSIIRSEDVDDQYVIMDMVGDFDIQKQREKTIRVSVHDLKVWEGRIVKSGCKIIQRFRDKERIPSRSITPTYLAIQDPYGYVWQLIDQHYLETMRGAAKPYDLIEAGLTVRVREICPPLRSIGVRSEEGFGLDGFVHDLISSADLGERSHVSVFQKYSSSVQGERFIFIPTDYNQDHVRGLSDIIQVIKDIGLKQAQMSRQGVLIAGVIGQGWSWRVVNQYTLSQSAADTEGRSADQRPVIVLSAKATMWLLNHPQMTDALRGELRALVRPYVGGRSWIDYVAIALCGVGSYAEGEEWVTQHLEFMRAHYGPTRSHYQWLKSNTQRALSASIGWYAMARSLNKPAQKPKSVRDQGGGAGAYSCSIAF
jgi:hypothetical protein